MDDIRDLDYKRNDAVKNFFLYPESRINIETRRPKKGDLIVFSGVLNDDVVSFSLGLYGVTPMKVEYWLLVGSFNEYELRETNLRCRLGCRRSCTTTLISQSFNGNDFIDRYRWQSLDFTMGSYSYLIVSGAGISKDVSKPYELSWWHCSESPISHPAISNLTEDDINLFIFAEYHNDIDGFLEYLKTKNK